MTLVFTLWLCASGHEEYLSLALTLPFQSDMSRDATGAGGLLSLLFGSQEDHVYAIYFIEWCDYTC